MSIYLGIDIGGTKTRWDRYSHPGSHRPWSRTHSSFFSNQGITTPSVWIERLKTSLSPFDFPPHLFTGIGIGAPGSPAPDLKSIQTSVLKWVQGSPLASPLHELFPSASIRFENDANAFTLAEARFGAGKKQNHVLGLTLGTGLGAGLVVRKQLYRGAHRSALEVGKITTSLQGFPPYSPLDQVYSGTGLQHLLGDGSLDQLLQDSKLEYRFSPWIKGFVAFLQNLQNVLDPDVIVIGGGVSSSRRFWEELYPLTCSRLPIKRPVLGPNGGPLGICAMIADDSKLTA